MSQSELAKQVYEVAYLTGEFKLRSGQTSGEYFDKYQFEARPQLLKQIAQSLAPLVPKDTEVLAGLELGGVPLATALSLELGLPMVFVRKQAKTYGTCRIAEGVDFRNKKVCVIEDVITTGGQVIESCAELKRDGAIIHQVLCVILRGTGQELEQKQLPLKSLFTMDQLKAAAK